MEEELGRIIRGQFEEIWTVTTDDHGRLSVRYERTEVAGPMKIIEHLPPRQVYDSDAPRAVKDKLLDRVLFADTRSTQRV